MDLWKKSNSGIIFSVSTAGVLRGFCKLIHFGIIKSFGWGKNPTKYSSCTTITQAARMRILMWLWDLMQPEVLSGGGQLSVPRVSALGSLVDGTEPYFHS